MSNEKYDKLQPMLESLEKTNYNTYSIKCLTCGIETYTDYKYDKCKCGEDQFKKLEVTVNPRVIFNTQNDPHYKNKPIIMTNGNGINKEVTMSNETNNKKDYIESIWFNEFEPSKLKLRADKNGEPIHF